MATEKTSQHRKDGKLEIPSLEDVLEVIDKTLPSWPDFSMFMKRKGLGWMIPCRKRRSICMEDCLSTIHPRSTLAPQICATNYILENPELFPGKQLRHSVIVQSTLTFFGIEILDRLIRGQVNGVTEYENLHSKTRRALHLGWKYMPDEVLFRLDEIECFGGITFLFPEDFVKARNIADKYHVDILFIVEISMLIAIANSNRLRQDIVALAQEALSYIFVKQDGL